MHHPPLHRAAAVALLALFPAPGAIGWAGEPAARVIYPVDYTAQKVRVFEAVIFIGSWR